MSERSNGPHDANSNAQTGTDGEHSAAGINGQMDQSQSSATGKVVQGALERSRDDANGTDGAKSKEASPDFGDKDALAFYVAGLDWPNGVAMLLKEIITSYKNKRKNKT
ncbi:hypothetical protein D3P09_05565 [Paenibacillus pinisoli]|uniref:Uncharacterized protein n=1 Tax=Paenibacillus pinisoli TaxID=1276110 RepID=A0A3A6PHU8_9BACL|nr:hypothetical protein [Paenibacillus pinisoli]RJX41442.1 hypothetical protein D3P09_05565 [Paenibacillus pinisoli]